MGTLRKLPYKVALTQYQQLDGRTIRHVPIKVHLLNGLQAAMEIGVPVIVILCDGLILQARYKHQVDKVLERAAHLNVIRSERWRVTQWIKHLGPGPLEKLLTHRPRTFTHHQIVQLTKELKQ